MIYFTCDHHFGHTNIITYTSRPFKSEREMTNILIKEWNGVVSTNDTVYHLGDFTLGEDINYLVGNLNGYINFVIPTFHHDKRWYSKLSLQDVVRVQILDSLFALDTDEYIICMCHYPLARWDRMHYGAWHLHGHSHGRYQGKGKILDVGVDNAYKLLGAYRPFSLDDIKKYMKDREIYYGID